MADKISLTTTKREVQGRKVKKLRKTGIIPANVYGSKVDSVSIQVKMADFKPVYKKAHETHIINLTIEGEKASRPVLISNLQLHPIDRELLHVDFRQVNLKEKIKAMVPLVQIGEAPAAALGAVVVLLKDEVEVEALPTDLPDHFEVDFSLLKEVGDVITIKDLKIDTTKVEIELEDEEVVAKAEEPAKEEKPVEVPAEEVPAEGEAPTPTSTPAEEKKEEGKKEEAKE